MAIIEHLPDPDLSLPLSALLREGTKHAHEAAESSEGAGWLTRGELDRDEYVRFLVMLWHVYTALEDGLERHAAHSSLAPTCNPTILARAPALASDIAVILNVPESSWQSHPIPASISASPPAPLKAYTDRLHTLSASPDPTPLLAHAYVRYLGDLSGGQIIRRRVAKAYGLDADGAGTRFYAFSALGGGRAANAGDMKRVKEWYRRGMDEGVTDKDTKAEVVAEANRAFALNSALFTLLRGPTHPAASSEPTRPPLGVPLSPTDSNDSDDEKNPRAHAHPLLTIAPPEPGERTVTLGNVIAVVTAVCLAHFLLVIGGFTSTRGYEKLRMLEAWLDSVLGK